VSKPGITALQPRVLLPKIHVATIADTVSPPARTVTVPPLTISSPDEVAETVRELETAGMVVLRSGQR